MAERAQHVTTAAGVVSTVILSGDYQSVDVINVSGGSVIYVRTDRVNPAVKGDECDVVVAGAGAFVTMEAPGKTTEVRFISAAATDVAVVGRLR